MVPPRPFFFFFLFTPSLPNRLAIDRVAMKRPFWGMVDCLCGVGGHATYTDSTVTLLTVPGVACCPLDPSLLRSSEID